MIMMAFFLVPLRHIMKAINACMWWDPHWDLLWDRGVHDEFINGFILVSSS